MNKYHEEIINEFKKYAGQGTKHDAKYVGTTHFRYEIRSEIKKKIAKDFVNKYKNISTLEFIQLFSYLYNGISYDERTFGGKILEIFPKFRKNIKPGYLDKWLGGAVGWAEVDSLCQSNFTAGELLSNWKEWKKLLVKLSSDKNISKRRGSLVLLTKPVRDSNDKRLADMAFVNIDKLKSEKDILITKAISWLLRDLIKNHRQRVELYLEKNKNNLPKVALRETKRKLLTGKK